MRLGFRNVSKWQCSLVPTPCQVRLQNLSHTCSLSFSFRQNQNSKDKNKPGFPRVWRQKLSWGHHNALPQGSKFVSASAQCLLVLSPFREICHSYRHNISNFRFRAHQTSPSPTCLHRASQPSTSNNYLSSNSTLRYSIVKHDQRYLLQHLDHLQESPRHQNLTSTLNNTYVCEREQLPGMARCRHINQLE